MAAAAACVCSFAACVRGIMQLADPQGAEGWALAINFALALHFFALAAALPWVWRKRG